MHHFIINPNSRTGKGIKIWEIVKHELDTLQTSYSFYLTGYKYHATEIAAEICRENTGRKTIVVLGGDGTVNEVINGILDYEEVILGYIPSGSSNDLARSLNIPSDPLVCLKHILASSEFKEVDAGIIKTKDPDGERKFAVSTGMGFDAAICKNALDSKIKRLLNKIGLGKLTYGVLAVNQLVRSPFLEGDFTIDGTLTKSYRHILMAAAMIHKYEGGGIQFAPCADPYDGKLSVCIIHSQTRLKAFFVLLSVLTGKHGKMKSVDLFDCRELTVHLQRPAVLHTDGEYPGSCRHIHISCMEHKLKILI